MDTKQWCLSPPGRGGAAWLVAKLRLRPRCGREDPFDRVNDARAARRPAAGDTHPPPAGLDFGRVVVDHDRDVAQHEAVSAVAPGAAPPARPAAAAGTAGFGVARVARAARAAL